MNSPLTDDQLIELIKTDKNAGFRVLVHMYQEKLYWHIRRMVLLHSDTDDLVQNTFIKVFKNIDKFQQNSKLYTWMYRIATNESISFLKSKKRKQTTSLDEGEDGMTYELKADKYFNGDKAELILQKALLKLPAKQKTVFCLRYYDEMSYKSMSDVLETSEGALKASYHHAVKKIEDFIKNG